MAFEKTWQLDCLALASSPKSAGFSELPDDKEGSTFSPSGVSTELSAAVRNAPSAIALTRIP